MTAPPSDTAPASQPEAFIHNLMLFGEVLRRAGLDFGSANMLDLVKATEDISVGRKQDFKHAARCLLVHRKPDLPLFDEAFDVFWRKPAGDGTTMDLRSMGEQRRYRPPQVSPPPGTEGELGSEDQSEVDDEDQPAVDLTRTYSAREVLRTKDFAQFSASELEQARLMMERLAWDVGHRRSRRKTAGPGTEVDFRRTWRRSVKYGGELLDLAYRQPKDRPRPLVLICDVSGSMERYTRIILHFLHSMVGEVGRLEAFLFATRLTRITRQLKYRSVDQAVTQVSRAVPDWAGGTRIGEVLHNFNFQWSRRIPLAESVVLIISDGWDRGEPELLGQEMARLQRSCHRLIWLNPLLGSPSFQPLTQGLQAALPYVDDFMPVHNFNSLEALVRHINGLSGRRRLPAGRARKQNPGTPDDSVRAVVESGATENQTPESGPTFQHPLWRSHPRS